MTAVMNYQFEDSDIDQIITALVMAPVQMVAGLVWLLWQVMSFTAAVMADGWQPVAKLAGMVAVTVFLATQPQIAIAVALIACYAWLMKPKG